MTHVAAQWPPCSVVCHVLAHESATCCNRTNWPLSEQALIPGRAVPGLMPPILDDLAD
jgi:hypothetical protein